MNEYLLGELLVIKNGKDHKALNDGNIPVYGSGGLMRYVNKSIYEGESILLPRKGSLENIQYVNKPFWTVDTLYYSIVNNEKANAFYLFNYLKRLDFSNLNSGTGVPSMTFGAYYNVKVQLPDLPTQQKIASVLSALDDKIELNNKINAELETMAKTLYDYWFIQFDFPNAEGKPYKSSGGEMVYDEFLKRKIPKGWEVKKLGKALKTYIGGTPSTKNKSFWNGEIPWMNSGEVTNFPLLATEQAITQEAVNKTTTKLLKKGSVLLSITRHLRVSILGIDACVNQSIAGIEENDSFKNSYIYFSILNDIDRLMSLRTGAQQPHINKGILDSSPFIVPNKNLLETYYDITNPVISKIIINSKQNQELASLRDWLLPLLMNGQVKVRNAHDVVEDRLNVVPETELDYIKK